jgi:AmmeMemoRadiSam system protein B
VIALISPHAGHRYSGPVAGYSFKAIKGLQPDLVLILSPYHAFHNGAILTTGHQAYQTPLGEVPVDLNTLDIIEGRLQERTGVELIRVRNDEEHAVEILLPFFQRTLAKHFQIVPIMVRSQDPTLIKELGIILAEIMGGKNALLAASSDLSHFFPADKARELDQTIIDQITSLNPEGLFTAHDQGTGSACGAGALAAVIWASRELGDVSAHHLHYSNSGDISGDKNSVVGYTSAVIIRE